MGQSFNLTTDNSVNLVQDYTYNSSTWTLPLGNATLTSGIRAPDGSLNAVRMTCSGSTLLRVTFYPFTPNGTDTYNVSFWVKLVSGTTGSCQCDLHDGIPTLVYTSELVLGEWVYISLSGVPSASAKSWFDLLNNATTDRILDFWGLTIQQSSTPVDISSAYVTKEYLIDNYPNLAPSMVTPALWLWGRNIVGQLGDNTLVNKSSPVQTIAGGTNWKQVSSGYSGIAIKTDGTLWSWGLNGYGQLGDNTVVTKSSPVQVTGGGTNWKTVSGGVHHTAAIKTDGTLWTWGRNNYGQLGTNTITNRSSPGQMVATVSTNWNKVFSGYSHTAAIKTDGTLWTWGYNYYGQLGINIVSAAGKGNSSPVQISGGGTNWEQVSGGYNHTTAIKTDGTLWSWGRNSYGQLGLNDITIRSSPVPVTGGGTDWKQVSGGSNHTAAIKTDGTLWTWGRNANGQLGDNTIVDKSTPVQVSGGGTNWKTVSAGGNNIGAIKTDGTLWTWGQNAFGQLGDNTIVSKSTPVQTITGGTNWKQVCCKKYHTAAISETGGW